MTPFEQASNIDVVGSQRLVRRFPREVLGATPLQEKAGAVGGSSPPGKTDSCTINQ